MKLKPDTMKSKIKKAEAELKKIAEMKQDLQRYLDCSWKSTLLKSCDLCEMVWQKELDRLKSASKSPVKAKKQSASNHKKFEGLSNTELEEIAFSIHTPDDMAQMALSQLLKIT